MAASDYIFSGSDKLIYLTTTGSVEVKDMFSRWKEWVLSGSNAGYLQAMRTVGGDPITETLNLGSTFFLINGWQIRPFTASYTLDVNGNLYAEFTSGSQTITQDPISMPGGSYNILVRLNVSNLVDTAVVKNEIEKRLEYQGVVNYDVELGTMGTEYPIGTAAQPVSSFDDAIIIARNLNIHIINMFDDAVIESNQDISNLTFNGMVGDVEVVLNQPTASYARFKNIILTGSLQE